MLSEIRFQHEARFANEQQDTPSNNACPTKNDIVIFRAIQHSAQLLVQPSIIRVRQQTLLQILFSKPSPFKLIAFVGKLDQDSGAL
jgi:hypothetical protein